MSNNVYNEREKAKGNNTKIKIIFINAKVESRTVVQI
jgi:hypothetical protein